MRMSSLTLKLLLEVLDVRDGFIQSARLPWCVCVCVRACVRACVNKCDFCFESRHYFSAQSERRIIQYNLKRTVRLNLKEPYDFQKIHTNAKISIKRTTSSTIYLPSPFMTW
jgi:hypothetical protein